MNGLIVEVEASDLKSKARGEGWRDRCKDAARKTERNGKSIYGTVLEIFMVMNKRFRLQQARCGT